jgi:hypothetical protein
MLHLGPLAFAQPWILTALLGLPLLWWLLRVTPPAPRTVRFPAIRLLFGLLPPEETPARTPWWLLLLRLIVAVLIILGLAQPLLNPSARLSGSGPLMLVIDDGWAAARHWRARQTVMDRLLAQAEREGRPVVVLTTAPGELDEPAAVSGLLTASEARRRVQGIAPKPWPVDRAAALAALEQLDLPGSANVVWLSDGLDDEAVQSLAARLQTLGELRVLRDADGALPRLLLPPVSDGIALGLRLRRASSAGEDRASVLALAEDGSLVARTPVVFERGEEVADARLDLPAELRNRIARLSVADEEQAGAVLLLDERWRRRPVGLVATGPLEEAQPLLSELYYLERALDPFTELRRGEIGELLRRELAVLVLPDLGSLPEAELERLAAWVERGGLLLRFAGPRLAEGGTDYLLPVRLRGGGRTLGGVMTWDSPARLAPFDPEGPFGELAVPDDVLINRQVLAEPSLELGERTWARLSDGTPLITAEPRGKGWIVLAHTTANTDWANLALSGLFVDILRRIVAVSQGVEGESGEAAALPPLETLDGFGRLGDAPPTALAVDQSVLEESAVGPRHPPGYYGSESRKRAHNLAGAVPDLKVITDLPAGVALRFYAGRNEMDLKPWLLGLALLLGLMDLIIALALRGLLGSVRRGAAAVAVTLVLALPFAEGWAQSSGARTSDATAIEATAQTRLAFVRTGVPAVDDASRAGLFGLTRVLQRRTSIEAGTPLGVDLAADELAFFPLLYWPVTAEQRPLTAHARQKVNQYLSHGGTILFDLREPSAGVQLLGRSSRGSAALQRLAAGLDIPPLAPVPPDHVLTKSFYLMQDFPGRFAGGTLWIGATEGRVNDGVASVIIGSNDWAGAWAVNEFGRPLFAVVPGGERQRELSYRVGVNLVMYALTGNYKADQVHVPFILERLGQ